MTTAAVDKGELIELPSGGRVYYVDDSHPEPKMRHSYWRCKPDGGRGRRLTGVSTVVSPLDFRPDRLMNWAANLAYDGVARAFAGQEVPADPHVLRRRLEELRLDWESVRTDAGTRGTNVHEKVLHALARGEDVPSLDDLSPEERGHGQAVMRFWLERRPKVLQAEQVVLSDEHGVAGRFDLRCELDGYPGVCLVDAKTGGFISNKAHAQLAGYDLLAAASGFGHSTHLLILQLSDKGTYELIPACADHETFLHALQVYRDAGAVGNAARKQREALAA